MRHYNSLAIPVKGANLTQKNVITLKACDTQRYSENIQNFPIF